MAHFLSFQLVSPIFSSYWICVKTDDVAIHWESVLQCLLELHSRSVQHARPKLVANRGSRGRASRSVAETVSLTAQHMILQFYSDKTLGACAARLTLIVDGKLEPVKPWTWISSICSANPRLEACTWNVAAAPGPSHHSNTSTRSTNRRAEQGHILGTVLSAFGAFATSGLMTTNRFLSDLRSSTLGSERWTPPAAPLEPHVTWLGRAT